MYIFLKFLIFNYYHYTTSVVFEEGPIEKNK